MKYIALLRGINVGGNNRVEMNELKALFESFGCTDVSTYINSGNDFLNRLKQEMICRGKQKQALKTNSDFISLSS
jgi:uncharacterized protein (DUF1697 family)